jgi:hypothetical protein
VTRARSAKADPVLRNALELFESEVRPAAWGARALEIPPQDHFRSDIFGLRRQKLERGKNLARCTDAAGHF